jgi:hypothetical protein
MSGTEEDYITRMSHNSKPAAQSQSIQTAHPSDGTGPVRHLIDQRACDVVRFLRDIKHCVITGSLIRTPCRVRSTRLANGSVRDLPKSTKASENGALACSVVTDDEEGAT